MRQEALLRRMSMNELPEVAAGADASVCSTSTPPTMTILFERHVYSLSNSVSKILTYISSRKQAKDSPPTVPAKGNIFGAMEGKGLKQLKAIEKQYYHTLGDIWRDWENNRDKISFRFETSMLRRAQLTA